jgi:hypothetical protein
MMYVAQDGNYGDAEGMALIDTTGWDEDDFECLDSAPDGDRITTAINIAVRKDAETPTTEFLNEYECPACGYTWSDVWTAQCDDQCPGCGIAVEPCNSEVIAPASESEKVVEP